jgi:hypothetical protein
MKINKGITVSPYFEHTDQKTEPAILTPALRLITWEKPTKPTIAIAKPTGIPKKKRINKRDKIPITPMNARLEFYLLNLAKSS